MMSSAMLFASFDQLSFGEMSPGKTFLEVCLWLLVSTLDAYAESQN
jgi:hypothetical protein